MDAGTTSIQQRLYPRLPCFGCGPANPRGLQLSSYPGPQYGTDGLVVADFTPWPEHDNGLGHLNGGIISTLLDCHSAAAVTLEAHRRGFRSLVQNADLPYVTAGLDVRFRRPAPLRETVQLEGRVTDAGEDTILADVQLVWDGKVRAEARATWKRWRPR